MSIEAMKQALEAFEDLRDNHGIHYVNEIVDLRTAIEEAEKPKYDPIELHVLHSHIAGVLFDFMGWLTTREKRLTLSSTDEAGPAVEAITAFAKMRGLRLEDAQVEHWQTILTTPPAAPVIDKSAAIRIATSLGWTPPEAPVQEPVAWMGVDAEGNPNKFRLNKFGSGIPLYTKDGDL